MTLPVSNRGLRPLRADAQRNRDKILAAAKTAFAEYGMRTQMDDIARRAGVGVGTLYRHFPTKDDLLHALVFDRFADLTEDARRRAADADDPWAALVDIVRHGVEVQASDLALSQAMSTHAEVCIDARIKAGLDEVTTALLDRARAAGQVREDATVNDLALLFTGLAKILEAVAGGAPLDPQRYVEVMLDGMRRDP